MPAPSSGIRGDVVGQRAAIPCAVAEDHVHLLGLVQPERDLVGEQVADVHDLFARVLERGQDADPDRPALGGERGQRGGDAQLEALVGLVGGQERDLVDHDQDERVIDGGGVGALESGEPARPLLHDLHRRFQQVGAGGRVGGVAVAEQGAAEGQLHQLGIQRPDLRPGPPAQRAAGRGWSTR